MNKLSDRFWDKVDKTSNCWVWKAYKNPLGYGTFRVGKTKRFSHRLAYEEIVAPVPDRLVLDHLCRNTSCCNPAHLEPVTSRENILRGVGYCAQQARKTHCVHGHLLQGKNLRVRQDGSRICRACAAERMRRYRAQHRREAA